MSSEMQLMSDYPAAHSMDVDWFAVDEAGHVALMDGNDAGSVPCRRHLIRYSRRYGPNFWRILGMLTLNIDDLMERPDYPEKAVGARGECLVFADDDAYNEYMAQRVAVHGDRSTPINGRHRMRSRYGPVAEFEEGSPELTQQFREAGRIVRAFSLGAGRGEPHTHLLLWRFGLYAYNAWGSMPYRRLGAPTEPILQRFLQQRTVPFVKLHDVFFAHEEFVDPGMEYECWTWGGTTSPPDENYTRESMRGWMNQMLPAERLVPAWEAKANRTTNFPNKGYCVARDGEGRFALFMVELRHFPTTVPILFDQADACLQRHGWKQFVDLLLPGKAGHGKRRMVHWFEYPFEKVAPNQLGLYLYHQSFDMAAPHYRCGRPENPARLSDLPEPIARLPIMDLPGACFARDEAIQLMEHVPCRVDSYAQGLAANVWISSDLERVVAVDGKDLIPEEFAVAVLRRARRHRDLHRRLGKQGS